LELDSHVYQAVASFVAKAHPAAASGPSAIQQTAGQTSSRDIGSPHRQTYEDDLVWV
jgi:hypothetical protein